MPDDCKHVLNYEETHCCLCMMPSWVIADENGINKLAKLEEKVELLREVIVHNTDDISSLREDNEALHQAITNETKAHLKQIAELKELLKVDNERIADNKLEILESKKERKWRP